MDPQLIRAFIAALVLLLPVPCQQMAPIVGATNQVAGCGSFTTANAIGLYDGDTPGLTDGAAVGTWSDTGGASNTLSQATGGFKPVYRTNILNGHAVVEFQHAAGSRMTFASAFNPSTVVSYFAVIKPLSLGNTRFLIGGGTGAFSMQITTANKQEVDKQGIINDGNSNTALSSSAFQRISFTIDGSGNWAYGYNGSADGTGTTVATYTANTTVVGDQDNTGSNVLDAQVALLIIYSTVTDMSNNNTVASCKYGI